MKMKNIAFCVVAGVCAVACIPPVCKVDTMRCRNNTVQLCDNDGQWTTVMDCDQVVDLEGGDWVCSEADTDCGPTCLPESEEEVAR